MVDLAVAMTDDATLLGLVTAFDNLAATTAWTALRDAADDILFRWAGVDGVAADPLGGTAFDTRKLAFLEKYFGYALVPRDGAGAPVAINVDELVTSWNGVLDKATIRLAVQGPLHAAFGDLPYDLAAPGGRPVTMASRWSCKGGLATSSRASPRRRTEVLCAHYCDHAAACLRLRAICPKLPQILVT